MYVQMCVCMRAHKHMYEQFKGFWGLSPRLTNGSLPRPRKVGEIRLLPVSLRPLHSLTQQMHVETKYVFYA